MFRLSISLALILSANAFAQTVDIQDETGEVFRCDFEEGVDANYDLWPDEWTRRRGSGFPTYIKVEITEDGAATNSGKRCLRMDLDGGAVSIYSKLHKVSPLFSYTLSGLMKTSGLVHDKASMEVIFYDEKKKVIESFPSEKFRDLPKWEEKLVGPVTPGKPQVRFAAVALHLHPGEKADLTGSVFFDEINFRRLPRMSLSTNSVHNIYTPQQHVTITCRLSGYNKRTDDELTDDEPRLRFELLDVEGRVLKSHEGKLGAVTTTDTPNAGVRIHSDDIVDDQAGFLGASSWEPPITQNGFYQVRVSVLGHRGLKRTVNVVVVDKPDEETKGEKIQGEFGWSLPKGDETVSLKTLASLLGNVGINWIKFPIWYDDDERAEQLAWFAERLSIENIELVGMLDQPPQRIRVLFGEGEQIPVASVFVEPEVWNPAIDSVMTRLSLKVRWWQLGGDQDTSFVNYPNLEDKLNEIRDGFNRFGQEINLGTTWRTIYETPFSEKPPLTYLSFTAKPSMTGNELRAFLTEPHNEQLQRWVVLEPLSRDAYTLETRARDLVQCMMAAKMGGAKGIFVPRPFDEKHGLMEPDGTPGPLLLPWRTAAKLMAGASYLGTLSLPNGSSNHVFERDGKAVMVVWNSEPTEEVIFLGDSISQVDLWGRTTQPGEDKDRESYKRQKVKVGPLPTFITGVNPTIAKWRMSVEFETKQLESVLGLRQRATYRFGNAFRQGVGGTVSLNTPSAWDVEVPTNQFKLSSGELRKQHMKISLGTNANLGTQKIRLDFNLSADDTYRFSVYRQLDVGLGDIELELESHLDEHGNLIVDQHLNNKTDRFVSFNCLLFVPNRRRERQQVFNVGRGRQTKRFIISDGEELIGRTLGLRAEEIGGARVLNRRFVAEE